MDLSLLKQWPFLFRVKYNNKLYINDFYPLPSLPNRKCVFLFYKILFIYTAIRSDAYNIAFFSKNQ